MGFFTRRPQLNNTSVRGATETEADQIILNAGRLAEDAMLDCFTQSAAFWAAYRRKETERLESEYPGYRDELTKRRAAAGLPPV